MNDRAIVYRRKYNIPTEWGTAVNVQAMVFGNTGDNSGSGVAFTRDPATGEKVFYGEFLINAQGEDVVAGVRTPEPVAQAQERRCRRPIAELEKVRKTLEKHFKDVQDFEFTIQDGKLFMLQTRNGKRTGLAAVRIRHRHGEGKVDRLEDRHHARSRPTSSTRSSRRSSIARRSRTPRSSPTVCPPVPARPPARFISTPTARSTPPHKGEKVLLVRIETSPEDLRGMIAAEGILTARGGVSSHAALVARQMGKVCVCGASALQIDYDAKTVTVDGQTFKEGDFLSIDGTAGDGLRRRDQDRAVGNRPGAASRQRSTPRRAGRIKNFAQLMNWCAQGHAAAGPHQRRHARSRPRNAVAFGATGIGLCRTEHMFFEGDRIDAMREMILAENTGGPQEGAGQAAALSARGLRRHLQGAERSAGDDPLPRSAAARIPAARQGSRRRDLAREARRRRSRRSRKRVHELHEFNPMLGFRGCRLGIAYPGNHARCRRAPCSKPPPKCRRRASR